MTEELSIELALVCAVRLLEHADECPSCDIDRVDEGILRLCAKGRDLFWTSCLATTNDPTSVMA